MIFGIKIIAAEMAAAKAIINTAPEAVSLAYFAKIFFCSVNKSTVNSIAVFISSKPRPKEINKIITSHSNVEIWSINPKTIERVERIR